MTAASARPAAARQAFVLCEARPEPQPDRASKLGELTWASGAVPRKLGARARLRPPSPTSPVGAERSQGVGDVHCAELPGASWSPV